MKIRNTLTVFIFTACFGAAAVSPAFAQYGMGGMGGMGGYGMGGMGGYGMGGPGGFGPGGAGGPQGAVTVKYGEKIYDAVFQDLIDYKSYYINVPPDQIGQNYFDDGTNGDEVAYDGLPSLIYINRDTYLGPFSIRYKKWLEQAIKNAERMGAVEFYDLAVASTDPESSVHKVSNWNEQLNSTLSDMRAALAQFEGYDDETYIKAVDPSLFESLEGFGGAGAGLGPGGMLPDMPPPPGLSTPQDQLEEGQEEGVGPGAPGMGPGPGAGAGPENTGRFNPVQNTQQTLDAAGALQGQQ